MDWLEFFAHSEWPVVGLAAIWILRSPFKNMLERLNPTEVDAWGLKAKFERELQKAEELTTGIATPNADANEPASAEEPQLDKFKTAENLEAVETEEDRRRSEEALRSYVSRKVREHLGTPPEVLILRSWTDLETSLISLTMQKEPSEAASGAGLFNNRSLRGAMRGLNLTEDERNAVLELRNLRNQVAHAQNTPISADEAFRYSETASQLLNKIKARLS